MNLAVLRRVNNLINVNIHCYITFKLQHHYHDVIMGAIASQITSLNRLFKRRSKKTSKLRVTGLCAGNSPGTGKFPAQMASYAKMFPFIWWRHHDGSDISWNVSVIFAPGIKSFAFAINSLRRRWVPISWYRGHKKRLAHYTPGMRGIYRGFPEMPGMWKYDDLSVFSRDALFIKQD